MLPSLPLVLPGCRHSAFQQQDCAGWAYAEVVPAEPSTGVECYGNRVHLAPMKLTRVCWPALFQKLIEIPVIFNMHRHSNPLL